MNAILRGIQGHEDIIVNVVVSLNRGNPIIQNLENLDVALKFKHKGVVGIDVAGDPTKGDWKELAPLVIKARSNGLKGN